MISKLRIRNYKSLKDVSVSLSPFELLVGPNGSGKSSFLDALKMLREMDSEAMRFYDFEQPLKRRSARIFDLFFNPDDPTLDIDLEFPFLIPEATGCLFTHFGYKNPNLSEGGMTTEYKLKHQKQTKNFAELEFLEKELEQLNETFPIDYKRLEQHFPKKTLDEMVEGVVQQQGLKKEDIEGILASYFFSQYRHPSFYAILQTHVLKRLVFYDPKVEVLRAPAQGPSTAQLKEDGSNVAFLLKEIKDRDPKRFASYVDHIGLVVKEIKDIYFIEQEHDRSCYFGIEHLNGSQVPSWLLSDGTLRLIALTLPAYLPNFRDILIVEEPENMMHPMSISVVLDSLSSIYDGQVLMTSHSPLVIGMVKPKDILIFSRKTPDGSTQIVPAIQHEMLQEEVSRLQIDQMYAGGVFD